ncbi:TetR/AcrR family transcriptional regulator [Kribbella sp. NBC_00709]|uniref:TetR/AcrR family transcriptional regulator n=1 Tax=Kribbella sp. NBC_00709 TaxID=2975972 RepID=UPI002E2A6C90|nr:TetR/AcrR family transcriptional regulator [Kribbella sp. NBC_00709]
MARPMTFDTDETIDKAVEVFWRRGFGATTPQNLVDELGIGKGSLYNTFKSKHHLFRLAMHRYSAHRAADLAEALDGPGPVRPKVRAAMQRLAGVGQHDLGCLIVNSAAELGSSDAVVAEVSQQMFERIEDAFRSAIERGQATGELTSGRDPGDAARALLAVVIGTNVLAKGGRPPAELGSLLDAALVIL